MAKKDDPVVPTVTFDSYVRPETVTQKPNARTVVRARYQAIVHRRAQAAAKGQTADHPTGAGATPPQQSLPTAALARSSAWHSRVSSAGQTAKIATIAVVTFALGAFATLKIVGPGEVAEVDTSNTQAVTRRQNPDLTSTTMLQQQEMVTALSKETKTPGGPPDMADPVQMAQSLLGANTLHELREKALTGKYTVTEGATQGIRRLALTFPNTPSTADLLLTAAERGDITVPASLSTPDGQVDTDTMLFGLIQSVLLQEATPQSGAAAREMSRRVFAASTATTQKIGGQRTYVVRPGDSLAYIAMQFYGRSDAYTRILTANAEVMTSANEIRTGQRLIIPE